MREKDYVTRVDICASDLLPLILSVYPKLTRCNTHGSEALEVLHALKDNCSFEEEEHPKLHQTEVPVVIE